jgi:hypothetical protein
MKHIIFKIENESQRETIIDMFTQMGDNYASEGSQGAEFIMAYYSEGNSVPEYSRFVQHTWLMNHPLSYGSFEEQLAIVPFDIDEFSKFINFSDADKNNALRIEHFIRNEVREWTRLWDIYDGMNGTAPISLREFSVQLGKKYILTNK